MKRSAYLRQTASDWLHYHPCPGTQDNIHSAFVAGAEWADSHPNWHKVSEELPPAAKASYSLYKQVLVARAGGNLAFPATYCVDGKWYIIENEVVEIMAPDYWMPMPIIPEE